MKTTLRSALFLIVGAIFGVACSHGAVSPLKASTTEYKVVDASKMANLTPKSLENYLNSQAQQGYQLQETITMAGWLVLVKQ